MVSSDLAPNLHSRTSDEIACLEVVIRAISVPEKNAESSIRITKRNIETGSKIEKL